MDTPILSQIGIAVFGILFGSYVTTYINRNREKVLLAFDFHKEFNNSEMAKHRKIAAKLIECNPDKNFKELCVIDEEKSISVLLLMRFYQRLWLSITHNQIKKSLVPELFGEVFCYWYYLSYKHNLIHLDWGASIQIKNLAEWFENNDKSKRYLTEKNWAINEYTKRTKKLAPKKSD